MLYAYNMHIVFAYTHILYEYSFFLYFRNNYEIVCFVTIGNHLINNLFCWFRGPHKLRKSYEHVTNPFEPSVSNFIIYTPTHATSMLNSVFGSVRSNVAFLLARRS